MSTNNTPATEVLPTITIVDQNTGRPVTWEVIYVHEMGENIRRQYGWTHSIAMMRPKGRRSYVINAELIGDVIVRHTTPQRGL